MALLTQLNRSVEDRTDRLPNLADLRVPGEIEQDADAVLMLYRAVSYLERKLKASGGDPEIGARLIERQSGLGCAVWHPRGMGWFAAALRSSAFRFAKAI